MNKKALGLAGLGAVALVGGTLAYFTAESRLENPFTTGDYTTELHEDYTPPTEDLEPGAKWEKKVGATNTGDYPVLVRIKMDEKWVRKGETDPALKDGYVKWDSSNKDAFLSKDGQFDESTGKFTANQDNDTDGLTDQDDETTVYKHLVNTTEDGSAEGWIYNKDDGYWYWTRVLDKNAATGNLMDYFVLASNIDMGYYDTTEYYQLADKTTDTPDNTETGTWNKVEKKEDKYVIQNPEGEGTIEIGDLNEDKILDIIDLAKGLEVEENGKKLFWKSESALDPKRPGYANSNYSLGITAEFVQATSDAVAEAWEKIDEQKTTNLIGENGLLRGITTDGDAVLVNKAK